MTYAFHANRLLALGASVTKMSYWFIMKNNIGTFIASPVLSTVFVDLHEILK